MDYVLTMRNPKSGKIEQYKTKTTITDTDDIPAILDFWENDAGYEVISFEPRAAKPTVAPA